jgi:glycosyltransferase involved in cell wall biosynthesis
MRTDFRGGTVLVVIPGGLEHGGGIGRQMGYFLRAQGAHDDGVAYRVVDSRGPWFLGSSPLYVFWSALFLVNAMVRLLWARLSSRQCVAHINITGRGSTIRKIVLATFARAIGLRYLLHVHDYDYADEYRRRGRWMQKQIERIFHSAAKVVVLGSRDQKLLSSLLQLPPDKVMVLHNAVPDPGLELKATHAPKAACELLFLGHLSARKGVPELLRALASPLLRSRPWRATLAGGGSLDEFRELAERLGISERVSFPGWVDEANVKALSAKADVLVLPSHAEGLAMAVLEGLSFGLVVIATPVGAHSEVIEPGLSGLLVPAGDVVALADALARVIDDEGLRKRLGTGARRRFLEKFDVRGYRDRLALLHADLL